MAAVSRLTPCLVCRSLSRNGSYCERHEPVKKPSPTNVHGLKRAPRLRRQAKARDGYRCVRCGSTEKLEVHHSSRVADVGEAGNRLELLVTLCRRCHRAEHQSR